MSGGLHLPHLRVQIRRCADLCDAARVRRRAARERVVFDVAASAKNYTESVALSWICVGRCGWWFGVVFQTVVLGRHLRVSPYPSFQTHEGDQNEAQFFVTGN